MIRAKKCCLFRVAIGHNLCEFRESLEELSSKEYDGKANLGIEIYWALNIIIHLLWRRLFQEKISYVSEDLVFKILLFYLIIFGKYKRNESLGPTYTGYVKGQYCDHAFSDIIIFIPIHASPVGYLLDDLNVHIKDSVGCSKSNFQEEAIGMFAML